MKKIYYDETTRLLYWAEGCEHGAINISDTWRPIKLAGTEIFSGDVVLTNYLNLISGTNISITKSGTNDVTVNCTYTPTIGALSLTDNVLTYTSTDFPKSFGEAITLHKISYTGNWGDIPNPPASWNFQLGYATSGKNFAITKDANNKLYVNVPYTDYSVLTSSSNPNQGYLISGSTFVTPTKYLREDGTWQSLPDTWRNINLSKNGVVNLILSTNINSGALTFTEGNNISLSNDTVGSITISSSTPVATNNTLGGFKLGATESSLNRAVVLDNDNKAYVLLLYASLSGNVSTPGIIDLGYTSANKNYAVQVDSNHKAFVNVPWTDTLYTAGDNTIQITNNNVYAQGYSRFVNENNFYGFRLTDENIYYAGSSYTDIKDVKTLELANYVSVYNTEVRNNISLPFNYIEITRVTADDLILSTNTQWSTSLSNIWSGSKILKYIIINNTNTSRGITFDNFQNDGILFSSDIQPVTPQGETTPTRKIVLSEGSSLYLEFTYWAKSNTTNKYKLTLTHKVLY